MMDYIIGPIVIPLPPRGFEAIRDNVSEQAKIFESANPPEQPRLSVDQDYALQQTASEDILNLLNRVRVDGTTELLDGLHARMEKDSLVDLVAVEADIESKLQRDGLTPDQERLILLAGAVGATARATVAALTGSNQDAIRSSIERAKKTVEAVVTPEFDVKQTGSSIGNTASRVLSSMLKEVEAI